MPPNQHSVGIEVLLHSLLQTRGEILFAVICQHPCMQLLDRPVKSDILRGVLDDRDPQSVKVTQITYFTPSLGYAFDLLNLLDFKTCIFAEVTLNEKCDQDGPLRVSVYAAASASCEGCEEEGRASRGFENLSRSTGFLKELYDPKHCTFGFLIYSLLVKSMTNISVGFSSSFCTPLGAMKILSSWRILVPPPVPVT